MLFDGNPLPVWIHDSRSLRFLAANERVLQLYGYSRSEFLSLTLRDLQTSPDSNLAAVLSNGTSVDPNTEWVTLKRDGTQIYVRLNANDVLLRGRPAKCVILEDTTERRAIQSELVRLAHHDALTGLPNRILLQQRIEEAFYRGQRRGHQVGIVCIDLDRFKQVNDWYGHAIGDECLKQVAAMFTRRLRGMDTVARTGGEEFVLVLGEVESVAAAEIVAKALLQIFSSPIEVEEHRILLGASLGVAVFPDHGTDSSMLLRRADAAMYQAKRAGGNRHAMVAGRVVPGAPRAIATNSDLGETVQLDGLRLHYQLQHRMNGEVRGVEALLRLPNANIGFTSPERFISIAEGSGMIHPIGRWVIEESCRQIAQWNARLKFPISIAVNVSPLQLMRPEFAEEVRRIIEETNVDPAWLEFEITERIVTNFSEISQSIGSLTQIGVRFAVDDFGTGYSSLQHLQQLPVSTLKIDRSFIHQLSEASRSYRIVKAMISMGRSLQMEVIAEGVETTDQMRTLRKLHCDCVQGFLLSRPASREVIEAVFDSALMTAESFNDITSLAPPPGLAIFEIA